jgi:ADP-heptose:LPS heptosyltransferase
MTYRTKLFLDRFIGPPVGFIFNIIALCAGFILRRDHMLKDLNNRYIVICKIVGLGSIVEFSYSLLALKKKYPESKVIFITSYANKELIELQQQFIFHALYIKDENFIPLFWSSVTAVSYLIKRRVDTFINLEVYSYYTTFLSLLSMARNRYGFYRKSAAFRKGIDTHLIYFNIKKPIREIYAQSVIALGVDAVNYEMKFPFQIGRQHAENVELFFQQQNIRKFIVINTNTSDLMPERRWSLENWKIVIDYLLQKTEYKILLSGNKSEMGSIDLNFEKQLSGNKDKLFNIAGKFNLPEFVCCLQKASMLITNDSGPLHLAYTQHTPSISLWGPTDPSHLSFKADFNIEICKEVYCSPCLHHTDSPPCKGDNICMKGITAIDVIEKVVVMLNKV